MHRMKAAFAVLGLFALSEAKLAPTVRLNNGYEIPVVGLGTYLSKGGDVENAVKYAIDVGYRHIDTAYLYGNEQEVGNAIRAKIAEGVIKREDLFVTTKLWNPFHKPELVAKAFQKSFDNLNIEYIDLYLIHNPVAYQRVLKSPGLSLDDFDSFKTFPVDENGKPLTEDVDYLDTWREMEKLVEGGKVRSIGISNFNSEQTARLLSIAKIKPVTNQVECHPNLNQRKLIEFSAAKNITITAYSPLGRVDPKLAISSPKILEMAQKYGKTPAQIVLRYSIQNGAIVIPKSTKKHRIEENFNLFDFELSDSEMKSIHALNTNYRLVDFGSDKDNKYYPFHVEF